MQNTFQGKLLREHRDPLHFKASQTMISSFIAQMWLSATPGAQFIMDSYEDMKHTLN